MDVDIPLNVLEDSTIHIKLRIPPHTLSTKKFEKLFTQKMKKIARETQKFWKKTAGERLRSSRNEYKKAISVTYSDEGGFAVELNGGFLPYAIDRGVEPYIMNVPRGKIVPLNVNRVINFELGKYKPKEWRTGTGDPWHHPGLPGKFITEEVVHELNKKIIPEVMDELIKAL